MRRGIAILAAILLGVSGLASAAAEEKTVLTLYINQEDVPSFMRDWVIRSSDAIAAGLPEYAVRTVWTTSEELKSNLDKGRGVALYRFKRILQAPWVFRCPGPRGQHAGYGWRP